MACDSSTGYTLDGAGYIISIEMVPIFLNVTATCIDLAEHFAKLTRRDVMI